MKYPAGLLPEDKNSTEFWNRGDEVRAFYRGENVHFSQVPERILMVYRKEMKKLPLFCKKIGITDDMDPNQALEIYIRVEYGQCDNTPDFINGKTNKEHSPERIIEDHKLSEREVEVLKLQAEGLAIPAIAKRLFISPYTVVNHAHSIKEKINAKTQTEVARFAFRHRIVQA